MNNKETKEKKAVKSTKKVTKSVEPTKKDLTATKKTTTKKATTINKKSTKSNSPKKASSTKKVNTKNKQSTRKNTKTKQVSVMEYYDLPYRYNQTIVKILAQTPNMLFVYWDISDEDRLEFTKVYGENFFSETKPVLIIHNETMNYSFEIEINDFANSWYLHVNDANCKYSIELGRRPFTYTSGIKQTYIYVSSSNKLDAPNDHVLFEKFNPKVSYKNTKNGNISKKDFSNLVNYKNMKEIYNIYDLYKKIYNDDLFKEFSEKTFTNSSSSPSF